MQKMKYINNYKVFEDKEIEKYDMYSGITKEAWNLIWKNKKLKDRETNVTSDLNFASNYSYNFKTGKYEDLVVVIKNIPLEAFISVRDEDYEDDNDFESIESLSNIEKKRIIEHNSLFLVSLYPYKDIIETELISTKLKDTL